MSLLLSDYLTTRQLAQELQRSEETLMRWRRLRVGPPFLRVQGRVLYDRKHIEHWLTSRTIHQSVAA
ncbi:MAG: helix-turn-helix domain-containing protein [Pseudoxanthomonas sp.]